MLTSVAWISGLFIDLTGDSGLYAAITLQMVESDDWFNLSINGNPYDQKPHLIFWLSGIGVKLFGHHNWAFKFFPFIYAVAGVWFTYRLGKFLYLEWGGRVAALMLATSQILFLYFFDIHTDTILQSGVILALWQLTVYLKTRNSLRFIFGFAGIGLAMLSKGPVGAVLPFLFVLIYLIATKDFRQLFHPKWILGVAIVLVIISPTLYHLYRSFGLEGIKFYFITNNLGRISGSYAGSSNDPFYYMYNALWALLPWTYFVVISYILEIRNWIKRPPEDIFSISMVVSLFIFFVLLSISKGKAPNYMLISVPPVMIITAKWVALKWDKGGTRYRNTIFMLAIATCTINIFLNIWIIPELFKYQGVRQVISIFEKDKHPDKKLYIWEIDEFAIYYYSQKMPVSIENWEQAYKIFDTPQSWIYTHKIKKDNLEEMKIRIDTIYTIRQRGMNKINLKFLNPKTRESALNEHYLIKIN
jgi:4-amino-4-deoxy-L-arabinose transferase-like glycosyltransferase